MSYLSLLVACKIYEGKVFACLVQGLPHCLAYINYLISIHWMN